MRFICAWRFMADIMAENELENISGESFDISLLYPRGAEEKRCMTESKDAFSVLELSEVFDMKNSDAANFLTSDKNTVLYRQDTFRDLISCPEAVGVLKKCVPILSDILSLRRMGAESDESGDGYLYSITEVELYMSLIEILSEDMLPLGERFHGEAMKSFCARVAELSQSEYHKKINERLSELTSRVRDIKSVVIGVNLDAALRPESAGVLAVSGKRVNGSGAVERILRFDFKTDEMTSVAPLVPFEKTMNENEQNAMRIAVNNAVTSVFKSNIRSWKKTVRAYVLSNTDFLLRMLPEIEFVSRAVSVMSELTRLGVTLSYPKIVDSSRPVFSARGLVNPVIALKTEDKMVKNDLEFDEAAGMYLITGPNRGGKSALTCAVGDAALMASLGLPVCAEHLEMSLCDNVFCHFPQNADDSVNMGRLGEECSRLSDIFSKVTKDSVVLLDESFSSTGAYEASYIASEVLCALSVVGCRTLFSTHLHELSLRLEELNRSFAKHGGVPLDSLVADISNGERSFKISRVAPEGKSYAADIAGKYGLSFESIMKKLKGGEK